MFTNQHEEHLAHSAPCASRWDGFDRGDTGHDAGTCDVGQRVIGRQTNEAGQRVTITESWCDLNSVFEVTVDGGCVHSTEYRTQAITVARWWMAGCPA